MTNKHRIAGVLAVLLAPRHPPSRRKASPPSCATTAALDEARGYCIDIRGQGANLRPEASLQGHTCKVNNWVDMLLDDGLDRISAGPLIMPEYNQCVGASAAEPGADLFLNACTGDPLQVWVHSPEGHIFLAGATQLCLTLAPGRGQNAGGIRYLRRDLWPLAPCDPAAGDRQIWAFRVPE